MIIIFFNEGFFLSVLTFLRCGGDLSSVKENTSCCIFDKSFIDVRNSFKMKTTVLRSLGTETCRQWFRRFWNDFFSHFLFHHSSSCHFLFSALYLTPLLLSPSPYHLPLLPPQTSSPILPTLHPFHLISPPSHFSSHLFCWKNYPFPLSSLIPCYSVLSFSPLPNSTPLPPTPLHVCSATQLFFFFFCSLSPPPSSSEGCSHLICWNTLLSQGRDQPQPISHMTEYAVCQWCMYAARGGATDG